MLDRFNLNLFFALDAILNTATLTEAARQTHLTQPAMSVSLKKLRGFFGDELVVYHGGETRLTALAVALRPRVRQILQASREVAELSPSFDPGTDRGTIIISAPDVVELILLGKLVAGLVVEAPHLKMVLAPYSYQPVEMLFRRPLDIAIVAEPFASRDFAREALFSETLSCLVWAGSTHGDTLTEAQFRAAGHVGISHGAEQLSHPVGTALHRLSESQNMVVRASSYAALPHVIIGTDLIVTTLTSYARMCAAMLPVRVVPAPMETPSINFVAQWQSYRSSEPILQWLIAKVRSASMQPGMPA